MFQDFPLLPKPMLTQFPEDKIGTLTDAIISQHASLRGIQQQLAEVRECESIASFDRMVHVVLNIELPRLCFKLFIKLSPRSTTSWGRSSWTGTARSASWPRTSTRARS